MKKILLVEDDALLNKTLAYNFASDGYEVTTALNAREAEMRLEGEDYDLVLLDVNLPDGSGYDLCRRIKPGRPETVVIFLTANDRESDALRGYELGAVDYITKPFSIAALRRKIQAMFAMLKRNGQTSHVYDDGSLFLDFAGQRGTLNGAALSLSSLEYRLLELLCVHPNQVLTRGQLLDKLWDSRGNFVDEYTLTTTVSRVRGKIEAAGGTYIKTVYGMGNQWTGGEKSEGDIRQAAVLPGPFSDRPHHGVPLCRRLSADQDPVCAGARPGFDFVRRAMANRADRCFRKAAGTGHQ